ncbi:hypothetical protein JCM5353_005291 [Sporobolomyces roseus]
MSDSKPCSPRVDVQTRRIVLASLWSIFLILGLPLWWYTTALERNPLPAQRMRQAKSDWTDVLSREGQSQDARVVKFSPHYKLVFSLLNQDSSSSQSPLLSWDIQSLLSQHFKPILSSLSPLHNFTIESQIQYFAPLSINLVEPESGNGRNVKEDDVRAFVNNAEWNLASGTTLDPVLHFILYVPSEENRPMKIQTLDGSTTQSFITPQRGGLTIYNPSSFHPPSLDSSFQTFSHQFRQLIGLLPDSRPGGIGNLIETRSRESLRDALDTLGDLVRLVEEQPNMSVTKTVQIRVLEALDLLDKARTLTTIESITLISRAQQLANLAYFDPSMLPLLYFPQEHKYAVYTPLFGPVAVPLVVGLLKELKEWREARKKQEKEVLKGKEEEKEVKVD